MRGCVKALNVPVIELLGSEDNPNGRKRQGTGPTGKMRRLFEAASQLPRIQQERAHRRPRSLRQPTRRRVKIDWVDELRLNYPFFTASNLPSGLLVTKPSNSQVPLIRPSSN